VTAGSATAAGAADLPPRIARRLGWAAVAWIALADAALWWIYYRPAPKELFLDEWQYFWSSESLLLGQSGNPYLIWPPAQSALLAWLRRALGDLGPAILAMQLWHTLLVVLLAVLVGDLARRASGSREAGAAAGLLFLAHPGMLAFSQYLFAEPPFLALVVLSLWLPARFRERPRALPWAAAAAGAAWGASLLFKSAAVYAWPLWLLLLRPPAPLRPLRRWLPRLALHAALFLGVGMAVTVPARLDSWREHGEWVIADTSVFGLWVGVNEKWRSDVYLDENGIMLGEYLASADSAAERREIYRRKVRERVAERGLWATFAEKVALQPYRLLSAKTNFVSQLPGPACRGHLPSYEEPRPALVAILRLGGDALHALTLVGFAFGLLLWPHWRHPVTWVVAGLLGYFAAIFFVGHVESRYAFWTWPLLAVFAGWLAVRLAGRLAGGAPIAGAAPYARLRWAGGAVLAALLVWFAFAGPHLDRMCT
jgi:hypothetical protein